MNIGVVGKLPRLNNVVAAKKNDYLAAALFCLVYNSPVFVGECERACWSVVALAVNSADYRQRHRRIVAYDSQAAILQRFGDLRRILRHRRSHLCAAVGGR